ncbi:MAG: choice-of-anchor D domain-containing protein [Phycisphaeraceae bacterium]|nr:choice-of-anchor D domain-containing protein [Phycisphaeraceae bacterium]
MSNAPRFLSRRISRRPRPIRRSGAQLSSLFPHELQALENRRLLSMVAPLIGPMPAEYNAGEMVMMMEQPGTTVAQAGVQNLLDDSEHGLMDGMGIVTESQPAVASQHLPGTSHCSCCSCTGWAQHGDAVFEEAHVCESRVDANGEEYFVLPAIAGSTAPSVAQTGDGIELAFSNLPLLHSNAGASAVLYLDFDGHTEATWGSFSNCVTPAYSLDGNFSTLTSAEIDSITEIWARVAEDYAPFNIDVTTEVPANFNNGYAMRVAIGGSSSDWYSGSAGGVAYINSFTNNIVNTCYVFPDELGDGYAKYVAEAISHEAGHTFGLYHQSKWSGSTKVQEYDPGSNGWAPIMGVGYYQPNTIWHNGKNSNATTQDDMAIIAGTTNGFGYRADDHGNTNNLASLLVSDAGDVAATGVISTTTDVDVFRFTTEAGSVHFDVATETVGANLDVKLELYNPTGTRLALADPSGSLNATIDQSLDAGTYYLHVRSTGVYGYLGQYELTGTIVGDDGGGGEIAPEVIVRQGSTDIADGEDTPISFGSVVQNATAPTITFTVRNSGSAVLTTSQLTVPTGFTIVEGLAPSIAAGSQDTFVVRLDTTATGAKSGFISFSSNDSDESPFTFAISGTVTTPPATTDLSVAITQTLESVLAAGNLGSVKLLVTNGGVGNFSGAMKVSLYASSNTTFDESDTLLATSTANTAIKAGGTKSVSLKVPLSGDVTPGNYYIIAVVDPDDTVNETNESNNSAVSGSTSELAWKFGVLAGKNQSLKLTDDDGTLVTFKMAGSGVGTVTSDGDGGYNIAFTGTTAASGATITASGGDGLVLLNDIAVGDTANPADNTNLGKFTAATGDLTGDIEVTGYISSLKLHDVLGPSTLVIGHSLSTGVGLDFRYVTDLSISSASGFSKLTAVNWSDSDATADEIIAPWISNIQIKGASGIAGDFDADLTLSGSGGPAIKLGSVKIAGSVLGRTWSIDGAVNTIQAKAFDGTELAATGTISKISLGQWDGGSLSATALANFNVGGTQFTGTSGDCNINLDLTGVSGSTPTLGKVNILGDMVAESGETLDWRVAGPVTSITVKGDIDHLDLQVAADEDHNKQASISTLTFNTVTYADVLVDGIINKVTSTSWDGGGITADSVVKQNIAGLSPALKSLLALWVKSKAQVALVVV